MIENKISRYHILFIGKEKDPFSEIAANFISTHFPHSEIIFSSKDQSIPERLFKWEGDLLISYLSQWIIPKEILINARFACLNFHPGPPEYPGIGCTNFAIYDSANEFGITCHHMLEKVDSGKIVMVKRFPVFESDTVYSITQKSYNKILSAFYDVFHTLMAAKTLPKSDESWIRKPFLRRQLNDLCKLETTMSIEEIELRIKATTYLHPWAYFKINNKKIQLTSEDIKNKEYLKYLNSGFK